MKPKHYAFAAAFLAPLAMAALPTGEIPLRAGQEIPQANYKQEIESKLGECVAETGRAVIQSISGQSPNVKECAKNRWYEIIECKFDDGNEVHWDYKPAPNTALGVDGLLQIFYRRNNRSVQLNARPFPNFLVHAGHRYDVDPLGEPHNYRFYYDNLRIQIPASATDQSPLRNANGNLSRYHVDLVSFVDCLRNKIGE